MSRYAEATEVPADRSRGEIERTVEKYGASAFGYGWEQSRAVVTFQCNNRRIRFVVPLPSPDDERFTLTETGRTRSATAAKEAHGQEVRRLWRALALVIKAMFEATASGIVAFEEAFLPYIVLPTGRTVADHALPEVELAYSRGSLGPTDFLALPPAGGDR